MGPCLAVWAAACGRPAESVALTRAEQLREARLTATAVADKLAKKPVPACGSAAAAPARVGAVVMINARQCLSCRDLGYMLRRVGARRSAEMVIAVPAGDTTAICPYLRQERVRLPVLAVGDADRALENTGMLVSYTTHANRGVDSVFFGTTGTELLKSMQPPTRPAVLPPPAPQPASEPGVTQADPR